MAYQMMPENKGKVMNKVDPELLVHGLLGLTIDYKHLSLDDSILGLTAFDETDIQIYDDAEDSYYLDSQTVLIERDLLLKEECQGRRNFTIMHEGSHQIYKMLYPREYGVAYRTAPIHYYRLQSIRSRKITDWAEWQANAISPAIVKWFGHAEWFKKMWKGALDRMVADSINGLGNQMWLKQWFKKHTRQKPIMNLRIYPVFPCGGTGLRRKT